MYAHKQVWLETGPRHFRGLYGLGGLGSVYPGSTCYDPSHDNGQIHCSSAASVILSAANPFTPGETTTCSDQETSCVTNNQGGGGGSPLSDPASLFAQYMPWIVGGIILIFAVPALMGRR